MYVGGKVWIFRKIHFLEAENRTRKYNGSRNLLIIIDVSQKKLAFILAENCKVKNMNSQKYPSHACHDTQKKLHSSSSNLALITDRWK